MDEGGVSKGVLGGHLHAVIEPGRHHSTLERWRNTVLLASTAPDRQTPGQSASHVSNQSSR